jgi:hypothetical protein
LEIKYRVFGASHDNSGHGVLLRQGKGEGKKLNKAASSEDLMKN